VPTVRGSLSLRKRLGLLLDAPKSSRAAMGVMCFMIVVIITSVLNFFIATIPTLKGGREVQTVETCCSVFFTIEVVLRTFVATQNPKRMMLLDLGYWIDVLCMIPFYVELVVSTTRGDVVTQLPTWLRVLQLLRLLRIIKLFRHYSAWRVILLALQNSWRALMVPGFAMYMTILILAGALYLAEEATLTEEQFTNGEGFKDAFDAMWVVFWLVATLGFDGYMGADSPAHKLVIAAAIVSGLIFTTMPITIIGEAFRSAWERKEVLEAQMKIQELLVERGQTLNELDQVVRHAGLEWAYPMPSPKWQAA
jgi:voltage-gated potassium channel